MRRFINRFITKYYQRFDASFLRSFHPYYDLVIKPEEYDLLYKNTQARTQTKESLYRRDRFLNLYSAIDLVKGLDGKIIELGCYKGLSSYLLCSKLRKFNQSFQGEGYIICDSFEGLSKPTKEDELWSDFKWSGLFEASLDVVKKNLSDFPKIQFYKGWIPEVLNTLPEYTYKFVHIDVDLVEPTVASFEYFYPRVVQGGVIVCDDYGSMPWTGTKKEVEIFCKKNNCKTMMLSTGQLLLIKT